MAEVGGWAASGFEAVWAGFGDGHPPEVGGAQLCVYQHGRMVADLWVGRDAVNDRPYEGERLLALSPELRPDAGDRRGRLRLQWHAVGRPQPRPPLGRLDGRAAADRERLTLRQTSPRRPLATCGRGSRGI
jgi:hypothetical protein